MDKKLKKCYLKMDLEFQATAEEVKTREKALIKILNSKEKEFNISAEKEIADVENSAKMILENIEKNGISSEKCHRFEASNESIICLSVVLFFVVAICIVSFLVI